MGMTSPSSGNCSATATEEMQHSGPVARVLSGSRLPLPRSGDPPGLGWHGEARMTVNAGAHLGFRAVVHQLHPAAANGADGDRLTRIGDVIGHDLGRAKAEPGGADRCPWVGNASPLSSRSAFVCWGVTGNGASPYGPGTGQLAFCGIQSVAQRSCAPCRLLEGLHQKKRMASALSGRS
jgi:hypothetical protein